MKKTFLAMLMVLAMLVSMVPMTAMAASEQCDCGGTFNYLGGQPADCYYEGYELWQCDSCRARQMVTLKPTGAHFYENGVCTTCGNPDPDAAPENPCANGHNYVVVGEEPATCQYAAYVWYKCSGCGNEKSGEEGDPNPDAHTYVDGVCGCGAKDPNASTECTHANTYTDTLEANCSAEGYQKVICKDCGETVSEEVLPKNDVHFFYNGKCMKCGAEEAVSCTHSYEVVKEQAPTCSEAGYAWYVCTLCGNEMNHEVGEPTGEHDYVVVKELAPNCIEAGYAWYECSVCGAEKNHEVGEIDPSAHSYEVVKEQAPTCSEAGYAWYVCTLCGNEMNHEVGEPTGEHDYVVVKSEAATCQYPAYYWYECSVCGAEKNGEEGSVNPDAHTYVDGVCACGAKETLCAHEKTHLDIFEASCVKEGYEKVICDACEAVISEKVLPVNDNHAFYNGKCLLCGEAEKPACAHRRTKLVNNGDGTHDVVCKKCGDVVTDNAEHSYGRRGKCACGAKKTVCAHEKTHLDIFEASCVKEGYEKVICDACEAVISEKVLPVNDNHAFYNGKCLLCGEAEKPACAHRRTKLVNNGDGTHDVVCKKCGDVVTDNAEHSYGRRGKCTCGAKKTVCAHKKTHLDIFEASCVKEGYEKVICDACDAVISEEILPVNDSHAFHEGVCLLCGENEAPESVPATPVTPAKPNCFTFWAMIKALFGC